MNFDQRSMHLNTEIGVVIDSPPLALQVAARFSAMVQPANSYKLELGRRGETASSGLVWITQEDNKRVEYDREPARSFWQRLEADLISLLPIDSEL
jgi:putative cardiolipin synthase